MHHKRLMMHLFQAELLPNRTHERAFDFVVARHGSDPAIRRIEIDIVICAVAFQVATAIDQTSHKLSPLHSEMDNSCFSSGTNALSAASSTIK